MAKNSKNIFLFFSRPSASFSYIITIYIDQISKNRFLGRFGTVRPKSRKTGFLENKNFFGKTLGSVSYSYSKEPSCKTSVNYMDLRGKCNIYIAHKVKCSKSQFRQILTCFEHA